jgi:uncharacterized protein (TIRG00374 family)
VETLIKIILRFLLAILLLAFLIFFIGKEVKFSEVLNLVGNIPKILLLGLFAVSFLMALLKALRMHLLFLQNKIKISFWQSVKVYMAGQATSPLPGGEAMRGVLTNIETKTPFMKTTGPVITQAFLELLSAAILAIIGALFFKTLRVPALAMLAVMLFLTLLLVNRFWLEKFLKLIKKVPFLKKAAPKLIQIQNSIQTSILHKNSSLPNRTFIATLLIAFLTHILGGIIIYLAARSFGIDLSPLRSIFVYTCGIVITALAGIVPGGLGFTEGGLIGALLLSKVDLPKAFAIVLIFRLTTLVFYIFIGLLFMALFYGNHFFFKSTKK